MKNKYLLIILIIFIFPLATNAVGAIYIQNANPFATQNLINAINNVSNAINSGNQAILNANKEALLQQQLNALDQTCAKETINYIIENDTLLKITNKQIDAYLNGVMNETDLSNPANVMGANATLSYLYSTKRMYNNYYTQLVINTCKGYIPKTNDQICAEAISNSYWGGKYNTSQGGLECPCNTGFVSTGTVCILAPTKTNDQICNGKSWGSCPGGYKFYCPPTGDAQCTPVIKKETKIQEVKKEIVKEIPSNNIKIEPVKWQDLNTFATTTKKKGGWSWLTGLFSFWK